jgi:hypothetical protein
MNPLQNDHYFQSIRGHRLAMNAVFRAKKSYRNLGIFGTCLYLALAIGCLGLFFLDEPEKHGFKDGNAAATMGFVTCGILTCLTLMCVYIYLEYRRLQFAVSGTQFVIRWVFGEARIDSGCVECVEWKAHSLRGNILFRTPTSRAALRLEDFPRPDRIRIIRIVHLLVPCERQFGWDEFCQKIALPLRDGPRYTHQGEVVAFDQLPAKAKVFITRRRYDRLFELFALALVASTVILLVVQPTFAASAAGVLIVTTLLWLLVRFSIPKEGSWDVDFTYRQGGKLYAYGHVYVFAAMGVVVVLKIAGVDRNTACLLWTLLLLPALFWCLRSSWTSERTKREYEERGALTANQRWLAGEGSDLGTAFHESASQEPNDSV